MKGIHRGETQQLAQLVVRDVPDGDQEQQQKPEHTRGRRSPAGASSRGARDSTGRGSCVVRGP